MTDWTPSEIRSLKHKLGVSYADIADECGVSRETVLGWLKPPTSKSARQPGGAARKHLDRLAKRAERMEKSQ